MSSRLQRGSLYIVPNFFHDACHQWRRRLTAATLRGGGGGGDRFSKLAAPFLESFSPEALGHHNDLVSTSTAQLAVPFPSFTSTLTDLASPRLILSASKPKRTTHRHRLFPPPTWHHRHNTAQFFHIDPRALRERERERERERLERERETFAEAHAHLGLLPT